MSQNTSINGVRYDFTTISLTGSTAPAFGGVQVQFPKGVIQAINYDAAQDAGIVQGNQIGIVGRTNGYGVGTGSLELLVSEFDDFVNSITGNGATPIMSVFFDLRVAFSVNTIDNRIDVLQGIKITKIGSPRQKGNDAIVQQLDLSIAQIWLNGVAAFGDPAF